MVEALSCKYGYKRHWFTKRTFITYMAYKVAACVRCGAPNPYWRGNDRP